MMRREFLSVAAGAAALGVARRLHAEASPRTEPAYEVSAARLPRWRGFNLLEKFTAEHARPYRKEDFEILAEWGFNFVRLPMSYLCWTGGSDWLEIHDQALKDVDQAVAFGRQYGVHVNLNFHRAPGYCVNPPQEPADLWTEDSALDVCAFHWAHFAKRYKGIPSTRLSFDLLNEPPDMKEEDYARVVRRLVEAIRAEDPDRLVIADGLKWGTAPVPALADLGIAQSTRGYAPMQISHYQASWIHGSENWPLPTWPLTLLTHGKDGAEHRDHWDRDRIRRQQIEPWLALQSQGVGVHVGEWGAFNHTPHEVALAWMSDCLGLWKEAGWGWALWNLRGSFGVLDSGRKDVNYEPLHGHRLDRKMLELLRQT